MKICLHTITAAAVLVASTPGWCQSGDSRRGAAQAAMCIGCHGIEGYRASFPQVYRVPRIHGQQDAYLQASLRAYRDGSRRHPTMRAIAQSLSDQDIADLASYYRANP